MRSFRSIEPEFGEFVSLLDKIKKNSTVKETSVLETSKFFVDKEIISTSVPIFNVALSGSLDGGFSSSICVLSGASRSFKTSFALLMAKAYLDKYRDSVLLFYDSEFGSPQKYFKSFGIDLKRVIHTPVATLEELRHDIMQQFANIERGDRVMILIDSISNLPSISEAENAEAGKNTADLQRNKVLKSIFRLITPQFTRKDIPGVVIAHSYQTMEMFSKTVVSMGTGGMYAADTVLVVTRSQEKDGTDLAGYNFNITIEKSRTVKERKKIAITVLFEEGISKYSGLLDLALQSGHVIKPKQGWYQKINPNTGEIIEKNYRQKDTNNKEFWDDILSSESFKKFIEDEFKLAQNDMIKDETILESGETDE
jgi:RecA/RadA recombinase